MDSNHRRRKPADLQSAPFGHSGICPYFKNPLCIVFSRSILETAAKVGIFFIAPNVLQFFLEEKLKIRADACRQDCLQAVSVAGLPFLACAGLPTPLLVILYGVMLSGSGRNIRLTLAVFFSILSFYFLRGWEPCLTGRRSSCNKSGTILFKSASSKKESWTCKPQMPDDWNGVEANGLKARNGKLYKCFKFRKCKGYEE